MPIKRVLSFVGKYVLAQNHLYGIYRNIHYYKRLQRSIESVNNAKRVRDFSTGRFVSKETAKKNLKKNFIIAKTQLGRDYLQFKKYGLTKIVERKAINALLPHDIKGFLLFFNHLKKVRETKELKNNPMYKQWKRAFETKEKLYIDPNDWKLFDLFEVARKANVYSKYQRIAQQQILDRWYEFPVKSPQTGNFSTSFHFYHPKTLMYRFPIRSGWIPNFIKKYTYPNQMPNRVKQAIKTGDYGVNFFHVYLARKQI